MKAADAAQRVIARFGTNDPFAIAAKANVLIARASWHPVTIGEFERKTNRILINERALENDKNVAESERQIVAHELGHFFAIEFDLEKTEEERFARQFAEELLK